MLRDGEAMDCMDKGEMFGFVDAKGGLLMP
jgi:hypothetical protein